jgi:hypothetical protein
MTIEPDTKDWTWVLERPCPECGFDASGEHDVARAVRDNAAAWQSVLRRPDAGDRPAPDVWSPLEYACHVRDVLRLYDERLVLMLEQDDPLYADWDQDAAAVEQRYAEQDPEQVGEQLARHGRAVADRFADLGDAQWQRRGRRSDGASFTVDSFSRYFLHDVVHHLHDVRG